MFKVTVSSLFPICFLFLAFICRRQKPVFHEIAKTVLKSSSCFLNAILFLQQYFLVDGSNHCLELIFSFEDTKFKVDQKLSHSSVRRYIRFGQFHLKHIGKVRLFAICIVYRIFRLNSDDVIS